MNLQKLKTLLHVATPDLTAKEYVDHANKLLAAIHAHKFFIWSLESIDSPYSRKKSFPARAALEPEILQRLFVGFLNKLPNYVLTLEDGAFLTIYKAARAFVALPVPEGVRPEASFCADSGMSRIMEEWLFCLTPSSRTTTKQRLRKYFKWAECVEPTPEQALAALCTDYLHLYATYLSVHRKNKPNTVQSILSSLVTLRRRLDSKQDTPTVTQIMESLGDIGRTPQEQQVLRTLKYCSRQLADYIERPGAPGLVHLALESTVPLSLLKDVLDNPTGRSLSLAQLQRLAFSMGVGLSYFLLPDQLPETVNEGDIPNEERFCLAP